MGWLKGIGRFIKRQARTKTGKLGMVVGATVVANVVGGDELAAKVSPVAGQVVDILGDPINGLYGLGLMYLRDKEAKKEEASK